MSSEQPQYGVVLVTAGSRDEADYIAKGLVAAKLAACIGMFAIHSVYTWQGEVNSDDEWQLVIKTDLNAYQALEAKIRELHSYDVPEIIALPVTKGLPAYLQWIGEQVPTPAGHTKSDVVN